MSITTDKRPWSQDLSVLEQTFQKAGFPDTQAYRYSSASVKVRVRDERFRSMSRTARMDLLEAVIETLSEDQQQELIFVLPIAPGEEQLGPFRRLNDEFEQALD